MKRFQGSKVLYFSYPSMFRTEPVRWLLYSFFILAAIAGVALYSRLPLTFHEDPYRWGSYLVIAASAGFGIALFVRWWFKNYGNRLVLTQEEATYIKGVFNTSMTEIRIADIRAVEVDQRFWEKMVGIGTIRIASAGSDGWEIDIGGMPNPTKVRSIINTGRHGTGSDD